MKTLKITLVLSLIIFGWTLQALAQDNQAEEIMKKAHLAQYYAGDDGLAEVEMKIVKANGSERERQFTMLRLDLSDGGKQDYYTYFRKPQDVSRLTFMVHKIPDATDNRWLYIPSVDLVKRISANDKTSSFVGSHFTYEDVSGRHWTEDNHKLLREDTYNDRPVYVIESVPKEPYDGFARKISYIDKENYLPLKEEYYNDKDQLTRVYTAEKVEVVDGFPTAVLRKMTDEKKKDYTTVDFTGIKYNVGVTEDIFTERYLKNPPRKYIK